MPLNAATDAAMLSTAPWRIGPKPEPLETFGPIACADHVQRAYRRVPL